MKSRIVAAAVLVAVTGCAALGSGAGAAPATMQRVEIPSGQAKLTADIARPAGNHRFPAVVLLRACRRDPHVKRWLPQLQSRGFVAIAVACRSKRSKVQERSADALAALAYLRSLSYVSPERIAVLGWSTGATAALASVGSKVDGFRAAVAFSPNCRALGRYRPGVLARVLTTASDPDAAACKSRARRAGKRFSLSIYRKAGAAKRGNAAAFKTIAGALASVNNVRTIFDPDSWVTAPLTPNAPLDPDQSLAGAMRHQIEEFGTWVNTTAWSTPLYVVPGNQPTVTVKIDPPHARYTAEDIGYMAADFSAVPLPPDAQSAGPAEGLGQPPWIDHELIVYQPDTDTAWELYHLVKDSKGNWSSTAGGKISHVSSNLGSYDAWPNGKPHGMTGYGVPMFVGLQRLEELRRGTIDHVVGVSIPHPMKDVFRSPGLRTDGEWTAPDAVPEGTRFRLPADLNIDALPLTPYAKMVAKAIQNHGLVVADRDCRPTDGKKCPAVTFKAEDPRPQNPDPYAGIFGGVAKEHLFDNFPWDKLQVLAEV